jgi:hypothetical protein
MGLWKATPTSATTMESKLTAGLGMAFEIVCKSELSGSYGRRCASASCGTDCQKLWGQSFSKMRHRHMRLASLLSMRSPLAAMGPIGAKLDMLTGSLDVP